MTQPGNTRRNIHLPARKPFDFNETLWFLDRNLDDCMHRVEGAVTRKAIRTSKGPVLIEVRESGEGLEVEQLKGRPAENEIAEFVSEWLDTGRDLRPFYKILAGDPQLASLARKYKGFHIVGIPDLFECLVWCIAGQQINLSFAYTLKRRLVETFGETIQFEGQRYFIFPEPATLLEGAGIKQLREMQFTTRKAEYILGIATAFAEGQLSKEKLLELGSENDMLEYLLQFRGIGPWTANYVLMKSMRAMDRIPLGDAGLNQALMKFKGLPKSSNAVVEKIFEPFRGWKTYLVFYLWRSLREMA